jgi:hypothetical protein
MILKAELKGLRDKESLFAEVPDCRLM